MAVDAKTVREMADLARLTVPDERIDELATEMNTILDFMGAIASWDGVQDNLRPPAVRRKDVPHETSNASLLDAASSLEGTSVSVPPVKGAS